MANPNIFNKLQELDLPKRDYVVVAGGVLVALGLLEWDEDIDIAVGPETFSNFQEAGWHEQTWQEKRVLKHDVYDAGVGLGQWSLEDLQADALWIHDFPFMSLGKLLVWKQTTRRPKDLQHVALIKQYLVDHAKQA